MLPMSKYKNHTRVLTRPVVESAMIHSYLFLRFEINFNYVTGP